MCRPAWTCGNDNPTRGVGAGPLASTALAASPLVPWTLRSCPPPCAGVSIFNTRMKMSSVKSGFRNVVPFTKFTKVSHTWKFVVLHYLKGVAVD